MKFCLHPLHVYFMYLDIPILIVELLWNVKVYENCKSTQGQQFMVKLDF